MKTIINLIELFGLLALCIMVFNACGKENLVPDCRITAPIDGDEFVQNEVITISVTATDNDGSITEVEYFFDGGSIGSTSSSPYNYDWDTKSASPGDHTIKATSFDNDGASASDQVTIMIIEAQPAEFTASPTAGDAPLTVSFTDQSTTNPTSWYWDFGDGDHSTEQSPSHTYNNMGQYDVTLIATNESGSDTVTKPNFITVRGTYTDSRDNQTYSIVTIGSLTWFAENLNYETSNSWWYDNTEENGDIYGRLYTWEAAQEVCPEGWRISSEDDWETLELYMGMSPADVALSDYRGTDEGKRLKASILWSNDITGTDEVGFSALPGGARNSDGSFHYLNTYVGWWTNKDAPPNGGGHRFLGSGEDGIGRSDYNKEYGFSVRCVKL
jgi:uncharacterized protein (TIGR02145 family)